MELNRDEAPSSLRKMEWMGITDPMKSSLCLLRYQSNGTLPPVCDCELPQRWAADYRPLGYWSRLRVAGSDILSCVDRDRFQKSTQYITELPKGLFGGAEG